MRIDRTESIAGLPAFTIRDLFRRASTHFVDADYFQEVLSLPSEEAQRLFTTLIELGYIEPYPSRDEFWHLSEQGLRLAAATAAKPLHRASADRIVQELLERVEEANRRDEFLYTITKVVVFGSYITDKEHINDIDVAVSLERKEQDRDRFMERVEQRISDVIEQGRSFGNYTQRIAWPMTEVMQFLKGRSRALQMYYGDDPVLERTVPRTIYEKI